MRLTLALLGLPLLATPPAFSVRDAIRAEWNRQPPVFSEAEKAQLSPADRARLALTLQRIGAPGAPPLLPPELDKPTLETWEAMAQAAKTPQERFTALFFLNRLKSQKAMMALEGLGSNDAQTWPKHLHLEAGIAAARLNGAEISENLRAFLKARWEIGKVDPTRFHAGLLRRILAGQVDESALTGRLQVAPGAVLSILDAWNKAPWDKRATTHTQLGNFIFQGGLEDWDDPKVPQPRCILNLPPPSEDPSKNWSNAWDRLGFALPWDKPFGVWNRSRVGWEQRVIEGLPESSPTETWPWIVKAMDCRNPRLLRTAAASAATKFALNHSSEIQQFAESEKDLLVLASLLPAVARTDSETARTYRARMIAGADPIARAAAIDDTTEAPADLDALIARLWKVEEYDGVQVLLQSLEKWKLPEERRRAILQRFADHPCWTARLDAWRELSKLDPKAPWPAAPRPSATDEAILREAERLAAGGKPVRMRLTFAGRRQVTLRLDPVNAPLNVANLVLLARKGFFNGRLVPRVVPDFVVQMGSPCDTMDGGPGYTVRCENSLTWYGPGSVGMALSGKDTGGSQFFITTNATPHLTGRYTRVGELEDLDRALKILDDLELGAKLERVEVLVPGMKR